MLLGDRGIASILGDRSAVLFAGGAGGLEDLELDRLDEIAHGRSLGLVFWESRQGLDKTGLNRFLADIAQGDEIQVGSADGGW